MKSIRLMLVDDHEIVRTGLRSFLESQPELEVVAEAGSGEQAIQITRDELPDVIIMDITMEGMDGLEATRRLKEAHPDCNVLALTVHQDKQYFFEMLASGATGYITKQAAAEELITAIHSVAAGHVYLQPALARWLLEDYQRLSKRFPREGQSASSTESEEKDLQVLSKRERQVLEAVSQGLTSPQIGEKLGISPKTVSRHRERIMNKLNLHSAAELVKFAIRSGLIDVE
jgi:two-component system response regulator NreC